MFKEGSGISGIMCNQGTKEIYLENLKEGRSFFISESRTFSIEEAVILKNWLTEMIKEAEEFGYFNNEITIKEIEAILGYKIKIVNKI